MKIGPSYGPGKSTELGGIKSDSARPARGSGASASTGSSASSVQLSDMSSKLAEMEAIAAKSDPFDAQKVDAIKDAISEGRFKVNPEKVADKLIASVREMLGGTTR